MKTPFIWLGSGRSRKWNVADKARYLDQAAKAGLPVPAGGVLLDEFFQLVVTEGVVIEENGQFTIPDPNWFAEILFEGVRFPRFDKPVVIRPAFSSNQASSGQSNWKQNYHDAVDINKPGQLTESLSEAWTRPVPDSGRRDVMIMEFIQGQKSGIVRSLVEVEFDELLLEKDDPANHFLPKLGPWQRPAKAAPPHCQRLQQLLRGVRRTFGRADWRVEWLDDGRLCWLLQLAKILIR